MICDSTYSAGYYEMLEILVIAEALVDRVEAIASQLHGLVGLMLREP